MQIINPDNSQIVDNAGNPVLRMFQWMVDMTRQVNQNIILSGSGTPESSVTASPTALYMDTAGVAGSILYVKKTGEGKTGWILV